MSRQELFTLAVAIAALMIAGRTLASRLEVPEAVVLGVLVGLIAQVPNIDLPPDVVLLVFPPPLVYNAAFLSAPRETQGEGCRSRRWRSARPRRRSWSLAG